MSDNTVEQNENFDVNAKVKELMKNNVKFPYFNGNEPTRDKEHLQFIYARLVNVYHEPENIDFMIKFKNIIEKYEKK